MNIPDLKLIIFDWDGTLIDSHHYIIETMLLAAGKQGLDLPTKEQVSAIIGMSMLPAIQSLFPQLNEEGCVAFRKTYTDFYNNDARPQPSLFPGVKESLDRFYELSFDLAIATGKRKPGLLSGLEQCECAQYFKELRTADDCQSKPSPDMVLSILEATRFKPQEVLVVGDSILDIQMSRAAGVKALGVTTGSSSRAAMLDAGATQCFSSVSEFAQHLFFKS